MLRILSKGRWKSSWQIATLSNWFGDGSHHHLMCYISTYHDRLLLDPYGIDQMGDDMPEFAPFDEELEMARYLSYQNEI